MDHKEGWAPKKWCFQTVVLEKTLENPLDSKGIKPVHPKGNQSWIFIGRTDAEAEAPILCYVMDKANSLEKTLMLGKIEGRRRGHRGWDGWTASLTQWTWVWARSRRRWRTGKPGVLQSMGSQGARHDSTTTTTNKNWGPIVVSLHFRTKGWCAIDKWKWKLFRVRKSCLRDVWIKDDKYQVSERVLVGWEDVDTGPRAQRDATCETAPKMQAVLQNFTREICFLWLPYNTST